MENEYKECKSCSKKPGSPDLCESCLHNRTLMYRLRHKIEDLENIIYKKDELFDVMIKLSKQEN